MRRSDDRSVERAERGGRGKYIAEPRGRPGGSRAIGAGWRRAIERETRLLRGSIAMGDRECVTRDRSRRRRRAGELWRAISIQAGHYCDWTSPRARVRRAAPRRPTGEKKNATIIINARRDRAPTHPATRRTRGDDACCDPPRGAPPTQSPMPASERRRPRRRVEGAARRAARARDDDDVRLLLAHGRRRRRGTDDGGTAAAVVAAVVERSLRLRRRRPERLRGRRPPPRKARRRRRRRRRTRRWTTRRRIRQ